ncbi:sigma factor-like helix-turn-helix DNA-binding protein [Actinoplanes xinjiangensis]|uniref:sigma factor-like helix-turn-helix DNA-binding protein n=1 Tax=Actinoplanes xinjiangensis TaxID=512350 RepID=UPI003445EA2B
MNTLESMDLPPEAYNDTPWTLVLPWLARHVAGSLRELTDLTPAPDWWLTESPAISSMAIPHGELCKALARVLVLSNPEAAFEESLPTLPLRLPISTVVLTTRARTTLQRLQVNLIGDLAGLSVQSLFDVRGTGQGTVEEIVATLVSLAILRHPDSAQGQTDSERGDDVDVDRRPISPTNPPAHDQLLEDLVQLSRWRQVRGETDHPLFTVAIEEGAPGELEEAVQRINALTPEDIAPRTTTLDSIADLTALLARLDDRQHLILRDRFLAPTPKTLQDLGTDLGVTRERARQIEKSLKDLLVRTFHYGTAIGNLLASMRVEIRPIAALPRLINRHPELDRIVPGIDVPLWLVLDRLDDYFEVTDGWAAAPTVAAAREQTQGLVEDFASEHGVIDVEQLSESVGMPITELHEWLAWCGYVSYEGRILIRTRSAGDHAAAILAIEGQPLSIEDIHSRMDGGRTLRTVANALGEDSRFIRTDRSSWALQDWNLEEYKGLRQEIGREIGSAGGEIALADLIQLITSRFDVSPASIQTYAAGGDFEINRGMVRRRTQAQSKRKTPADTRRMFRQGDHWRLRITVSNDHLRGSGFPVPTGVATLLGCDLGDVVELGSRLGNQPIRWTGTQPSCGTIKRFLEVLEAKEGDSVFLEFGPDRTFDVTTMPHSGLTPIEQAVALTGAVAVEDSHTEVLAEAVDLPTDAKPRHILAAYYRRGDEDIARYLEAAWTRSPVAGDSASTT